MRFSKTWRYLRLQIFLSREGKIDYLYLKNNWNSNFTKLSTAETKILTTSQTKNAQASRISSFGIFTSPRPILLASGTGPPTNFEDWIWGKYFLYISHHSVMTSATWIQSYKLLFNITTHTKKIYNACMYNVFKHLLPGDRP